MTCPIAASAAPASGDPGPGAGSCVEPQFPALRVPRARPWQARPTGPNGQERDLRLCGSTMS